MALKKINGGVAKHIECKKKCGTGWLVDLRIYENKYLVLRMSKMRRVI